MIFQTTSTVATFLSDVQTTTTVATGLSDVQTTSTVSYWSIRCCKLLPQ